MLVGKHRHWTRTSDKYTGTGIPEICEERMSGSPPARAQDEHRQRKRTLSQDRNENSSCRESKPGCQIVRQGYYRALHGNGNIFISIKTGLSLQTEVAVLSKGRSSTANSGTKVAILLGKVDVVASHCFLCPTLSLASKKILKDLERSQGPQHGDGEWIWLTGPSGLTKFHHRG